MRLSVATGTNVQAMSENAPVNPALSNAGMSLLPPPPLHTLREVGEEG